MMPDIMDAQPSLAEVQPGGTITLECAYSLQDTANPITTSRSVNEYNKRSKRTNDI